MVIFNLNFLVNDTEYFLFFRKHGHNNQRGKIFLTSTSDTHDKRNTSVDPRQSEVIRTSEYGYAHVWELQYLKSNNPDVTCTLESANNEKVTNIDQCITPHNCGTYSGRSTLHKCKHHMYDRTTLAHGDDINCPIEEPPFYHEFDSEAVEVR